MKRAIALLLAAAMAITMLASCGTNEKQAYLNAMLEGTGFSGVVLVTKNGKTVPPLQSFCCARMASSALTTSCQNTSRTTDTEMS